MNLLRGRQKLLLAVNCSSGVLELRACLAWPCLQVIKQPLHVWRSCSLYLRFNKLEFVSICYDLPCILHAIFTRLILDKTSRGARDLRHVSLESMIPALRPLLCLSHNLSIALVGAYLQFGHDS